MRAALKWWWSARLRRYLTVGGVLMVLGSIASVELTSQSWFCNSCHIMNSYYASWKAGPHKQVECIQCHIAPGMDNFVTAKLNGLGQVVDDVLHRESSKPSACVSDFACTRAGCHDVARVRASSPNNGKFLFNHGKHLDSTVDGIEIHCTTCHSHYQGDKHFEVNTNVCITCHLMAPQTKPGGPPAAPTTPPAKVAQANRGPILLAKVAAADAPHDGAAIALARRTETVDYERKVPPHQCRNCHVPPDKPIDYNGLKVVHAEYLAYGAACESCHRNVTTRPEKITEDKCFGCHDFGLDKLTTTTDLHHVHNTGKHKIECFSCHGLIKHGPVAQSMRLDQIDCQACHRDQHLIQRETYTSAGTMPATAAVATQAHQQPASAAITPMFLAHVDCTGCHIENRELRVKPRSGATVAAASPKACDSCHKPGLGDRMVPMWQKNTHQLYDQVAALLPPASQPPADSQGQQRVTEARQILDLVRLDGSWGVHSPVYTEKLLQDAKAKLTPTTQPAAGGGR